MRRELIYSQEYLDFIQGCSYRTREKLHYATSILESVIYIPAKFVKKLINTDFYELRISVDNDNINLATTVIFLNGFVKKGTKDYDREITKAINILISVL